MSTQPLSLFDFLPENVSVPDLNAPKTRKARTTNTKKSSQKFQERSLFDFIVEAPQEEVAPTLTQEAQKEEVKEQETQEIQAQNTETIEATLPQDSPTTAQNQGLLGYGIPLDKPKTNLAKIDFSKDSPSDLGSPKLRVQKNLQALELALTITQENRYATKEEQEVLAGFSGFGGLNFAFGDNEFGERLKAFLDKTTSNYLESAETYARILNSSNNAYYTNDTIIDTIYQGLERLGLKNTSFKKEILEPSCGSGNFLHRADKSAYHFTAIELEKHTAMIAGLLHPNSKIINAGFQNAKMGKKFDAAIGNPPFGQDRIKDPTSLGHNQAIDDYFVIKSLESLKDKGILAFVMPTGFLDNNQNEHLEIVKNANGRFLGAVRLPNTAFKQSGTEVNTDIIFMQKEPEFIEQIDNGKVKVVKNKVATMPMPEENSLIREEIQSLYYRERQNDKTLKEKDFFAKFQISSYFLNNPQNILGRQVLEKNQFGEYRAVVKSDGRDLGEELQRFIQSLPQNIYEYTPSPEQKNLSFDFMAFQSDYIKTLQNGHYFYNFDSQTVCKKLSDQEYMEITLSAPDLAIAKDYILLRDSLNALSRLELAPNAAENEIAAARENLNQVYDSTKSKHKNKPLHKTFSKFEDELHFNLIANLEDENGNKRDIFTKRIAFPEPQLQISNAKEAYIASFSKFGRLNLEFLAQALPQNLQTTLDELEAQRLIFKNHNNPFQYIPRDEYLSGNVKQKYKEVECQIYEKGVGGLEANLASLKEAFPKDKSISEIYFNLGMPFIPNEIYTKFAKHAVKLAGFSDADLKNRGAHNGIASIKVGYTGLNYVSNLKEQLSASQTNKFSDNNPFYREVLHNNSFVSYDEFRRRHSYLSDDAFERMKKQAFLVEKFDEILSRQSKVITKSIGKNDKDEHIYKMHEDLTADLNSVAKDLQGQFMQFVLSDLETQKIIAKAYNDTLNTDAKRDYGGNYLDLSKLGGGVELREHQKSAAWRGILNKSTLINHEVGSGKTMTGAVIALESKSMNLATKPMIIAPNHLLPSWEAELKRLYPDKNILIADHKSMNKNKREAFLSKIKLNDYDLIVIKESQFKLIKKNEQALLNLERKRLAELTFLRDQAEKDDNAQSVRKLKNAIKKQTEQIEKLLNKTSKQDNMISFDELGVDCLIVDEAHSFKNLHFTSQKQKVLGLGNQVGSAKAKELYTITQAFHEENKKVVFLTGTPITNSLSEMYHMQRYLQPEWLEEKGLNTFDAWANTFGNDVSDYELDAGGSPKMVTRFSEFNNLQELVRGFGHVNDYVSREKIEESLGKNLIPKAQVEKIIAKRSPEVANFFGVADKFGNYPKDSLLYRFANFKEDPVLNNPLRLTSYARLASLDYRCIENNPAFDFADSKINLCVKNIVENYHHNKAESNSTQLVFCDLAVAKEKLSNISATSSTKERENGVIENAFSVIYADGNIEKLEADEYERFVKTQKFGLKKEDLAAALKQGWVIEQNEDGRFNIINPNSAESEVNVAAKVENFTNNLTKFDAYKDIALKLMEAGIPKEHIAFIHDYKKDSDKQELYKKLNNGEVRILIGSTEKMGTGMNVQKRLVALHNLDCPWRPDGYIQRNGRIERQGNMFFEQDSGFQPKIYNYATEMSYDVKAYQIVESKAKAIDTIQRANELNIHSFEDISQNAITFAEMKAISSGNPLLLEQFKIDNELKALQKQQKLFLLNQCETKNQITDLSNKATKSAAQIKTLEQIQAAVALDDKKMQLDYSHLQKPRIVEIYKDGSFRNEEKITVLTHSKMEKEARDKEVMAANDVFLERIRRDINNHKGENGTKDFPKIMSYRGLNIAPRIDGFSVQFCVNSQKENSYYPSGDYIEPRALKMSKDMFFEKIGYEYFLGRLDNFLKDIDKHLVEEKQNNQALNTEVSELIKFRNQSSGAFPKQDLLEALKNDKETIVEKIKSGDKAWIPTYKSLKEQQPEAQQKVDDLNLTK